MRCVLQLGVEVGAAVGVAVGGAPGSLPRVQTVTVRCEGDQPGPASQRRSSQPGPGSTLAPGKPGVTAPTWYWQSPGSSASQLSPRQPAPPALTQQAAPPSPDRAAKLVCRVVEPSVHRLWAGAGLQ